jgi:hypothetical protein
MNVMVVGIDHQGAFSMVTVHLTRQTLDLNLRGEWMHDVGHPDAFPGKLWRIDSWSQRDAETVDQFSP